MAAALVSGVLEQLTSIGFQAAESGVRLLVGVNEEVGKIQSTLQIIRAVLVDAETRQVKEQAVKLWLHKLQHVAYDIEDVLDEWRIAILRSESEGRGSASSATNFLVGWTQTSSVSIPRLVQRRDIAVKIKELNERLQALAKEKDDYGFIVNNLTRSNDLEPERPKTASFIDLSEICGRDQDKNALVSMLLSENNAEERGIPLISIVGMGGIGKTTLAQMLYNHRELKAHFQMQIWVCVSDPFDEMRIAKAILESLTGVASSFNEFNTILERIHEIVSGNRFLLVLDDVWTEDERKWQPLKYCLSSGSQGSKILVTTRKANVATILGSTKLFNLGKLSKEECWSLFRNIAFSGRNDTECGSLEDIGRKIADKCQGLPLAAKTLGGLLRFKTSREQWQRILDSHMWEIDGAESGLFSPLLLSYYDLPSPLRQCFSYCAIFPKDHKIEKALLIKLWMAQGFLGETQGNNMIIGEEYFGNLAMRSFFHEFEKDENDSSIISCKMHDMVHEFAQFLRKTECFIVSSNGIDEQEAEYYYDTARHLTLILDDDRVGIPDPIYYFRKLRSLLVDSSHCGTSTLQSSLPTLFDQLTSLRMLDLGNHKIHNRFRGKSSIKELPIEIGQLIHLRYFSLEGNAALEYLPNELSDLCNLQTLNIRLCSSLKRLPSGITRLINLRHLQNAETYGCRYMPLGIQNLTHLQTLEEFVVCREVDSFGGLGGLVHLQGNLKIVGLGNLLGKSNGTEKAFHAQVEFGQAHIAQRMVDEANVAEKAGFRSKPVEARCMARHEAEEVRHKAEEVRRKAEEARRKAEVARLKAEEARRKAEEARRKAEEARLRSKTGLLNLTLSFNSNSKDTSIVDEALVLEALQPPPFLEYLNINRMNGPTLFPSWLSSLTMLKRVTLWACFNWETLPPMGKLPCLEHLEICEMKKVKMVGQEFIGAETEEGQTSSSPSSVPNNAFPCLKHLKFQFMEEWEEWECGNLPTIMPHLCSLKINNCLKLKSLPPQLLRKTTLQVLDIFDCPILKTRCLSNGRGDDWCYISHIPTITIDGEAMQRDQ